MSEKNPNCLMQGVIPYLSVNDARRAIDFYQRALGAEVFGPVTTIPGEDRVANVSLVINGGVLMLADACPERGAPAAKGGHGFTMQLVITDGDMWWQRALSAGCEVRTPFAKQFWGDRYGALLDPFGIEWAFNEPSAENRARAQEHAS